MRGARSELTRRSENGAARMGRCLLWLALCLVAVSNVSGAGKPPWCTLKPAQFAKCKKFGGCCGEISKTSKMSKCVLFGTTSASFLAAMAGSGPRAYGLSLTVLSRWQLQRVVRSRA